MVNANKQVWKQFIQGKIEMLTKFEQAKTQSSFKKVKASHGNAAEGIFRAWLESFLPKRYGVTSGYLVSQADLGEITFGHFDVIIYDQLSSPILWIEKNPDNRDQGKSRAIPVEYTLGVIEVKSKLTPKSVDMAFAKLKELDPYLAKVDDSNERYKLYLPEPFLHGLFFLKLIKHRHQILGFWINLSRRDFIGAVILSGEGNDENSTGRTNFYVTDSEIGLTPEEKTLSLLKFGIGTRFKVGQGYVTAMIMWNLVNFSTFAFDILALLNGTYQPGRASSFHGLGIGISTTPKNVE